MFRFDYDAGRCVFEQLTCKIRVSKLFRPHELKPPQWGQAPLWWFWRLEDELVVVGGGDTAFGGGAEGSEGVARERHGPAQTAASGDGTG